MKITESRANDILHWLDNEAENYALLFEKMTLHRDAAALIRQLQAELQDAWQAGLDAGREQGRGKNAASVQPELVAVALAACDAVDDLIEKWYATRESGCLPNQVVRAKGASKLLRAIALEA